MAGKPSKGRVGAYVLFALFIVAGIVMKRVFGHAEWLPVFHIAALFTLIGISVTSEQETKTRSTQELLIP